MNNSIRYQWRLISTSYRSQHCSLLQCAVCSMQCALCSVHCTVCSVYCALCIVQCAVCSVHCAVCIVHFALCSVQCAVCSVRCAVCSVQPLQSTIQLHGLYLIVSNPPINQHAQRHWRIPQIPPAEISLSPACSPDYLPPVLILECVSSWKCELRYVPLDTERLHTTNAVLERTWREGRTVYSRASHNDVSANDGPHIRRWSHNIIILQYYNTYHCVTIAYSIQYSNMLYGL